MTFRKQVIAEIARKNTANFGRSPSLIEYVKFRFAIRTWSYEQVLQGLVTININVFSWGRMREYSSKNN